MILAQLNGKDITVFKLQQMVFKEKGKAVTLAGRIMAKVRKASLVSVRIGSVPMEDVDDAFKEIDLLFGEYYKEIENEHEEIVNGLKWAKYLELSICFDIRWIRMKIKKAIEDSGFIYSAWESHKDKYLCLRKIKRRMHNITYLRKLYGDNYDPYWDKETVTDDIPLECKESKEKREKQQNELEECLELLAEGKLAAAQKYLTIQKIRKREEGLDEMMEPIELESSEVTYEEFSDEEEKQKEITSIESPSSKIQIESSRPTIDESEEDLQEGSISSIDKPMDTVPKRSVSFLEFDQNLDFESSEDELDLDTQSLTLKAEMKTQSTSTSEEEEFYEGEPPVRYIPPPRLMPSDFSLEDEEPDEPEYSEKEEGEGEEEEGDEEEDKGKVEGQLKEGFGISSPTAKHLKHTSDEDDEFNEID
ncbi:hypothetical protein AAG570_000595 [Ranatra chinensis]|uniref:Uncharacterized protein n=1 Tax=Ranatra chinensis TaxID=642074 RepID=A0ABD0YXT4_9HEMI